MQTSWRQWCRLCAQENSPIGIFSKNENNCDIAELIMKCLQLNINPLDEAPVTICTTCYQFLLSVARFAEQASKVEAMYASLAFNDMNSIDSSSIKYQFGVVKEEPPMWVNRCDQSTDTLDLDVKCSRDKFDQLAAQADVKEVLEEMCVDDLPDDAYNNNDSDDEDPFTPSDKVVVEINEPPRRRRSKRITVDPFTSSDKIKVEINESPKRKVSKRKEQSYPCDLCEQSFPRRNELRTHKKTSHTADEKKEFPCEKCDKKFPSRKRVKQHEIIHLDPEQRTTYPCPSCDKTLTTRTNLKQHLRKIHLGDRPFMCEICGKSFASNCDLKEHNYTHMEDTPFKCSTCSKKFTTLSGLKKHEDIHSGTTYVCPNCGLILNTRRTLQRHMVVHSDQKKYKCTVCSSEFKRAKSLKNHLILHTGLRPYTCPFCDKTFANGSNCRSHKKKAHPFELAAMEVAGVLPQETKLPELKQLKTLEAS